MRTLLLTPWMSPHKVISWETAITLIYLQKAEVLEEYDEEIRSPSITMKVPAVIRLNKPLDGVKRGVKFSRINVFTRDGFRCQYCGNRKQMKELNYDHVVPRVKGGKTNWENIVACCYDCNDKKGQKTPEQAGMRLLRKPFKPKSLPHSFLQVDRMTIPDAWSAYCKTHGLEEDHKGIFLLTGT